MAPAVPARSLAQARETVDPRVRAALLSQALGLWRGPAFGDFADEPPIRPAAARLAEQRLAAQEELAETRLALGEHSELIGSLADLITENPLRERLRAAHMQALYRAGRPSEALDSYEEFRVTWPASWAWIPAPSWSPCTGHPRPDPALAAPGFHRAAARYHQPPRALSRADRQGAEAVTGIRALLGRSRLVTLTGPGGVGKTRLAIETARHLTGSEASPRTSGLVPDGVWLARAGRARPPRRRATRSTAWPRRS